MHVPRSVDKRPYSTGSISGPAQDPIPFLAGCSAWCGPAIGRIRPEKDKPGDAVLFGLLAEWAPDEAMRTRILVQNPATLYGFPASA